PFDSTRKMMTTIHKTTDGYLKITKGAPNVLIKRCNMSESDRLSALNPSDIFGTSAVWIFRIKNAGVII
ncbi:MAG: hypothetical protein IKA30_03905, partial [Alphaproteobacteria bacterium]|nr:hypothetical protein [Alphaproteobacteria bacterium]